MRVYGLDADKEVFSFENMVRLFQIGGEFIDETEFFFADDPEETDHMIGFLPEYDKPYWCGHCDVQDGCEFSTAVELFNARIFDGKSIRERWDTFVLTNIGGLSAIDMIKSVPVIRKMANMPLDFDESDA